MMSDYQIKDLTHLFRENAHSENAVRMAQYMKGHFPFFGIKSTLRRELQREWWRGQSIQSEPELQSIISVLWKLDEREYQYVGLDLGKRNKKYFTPASIPFIQKWVTTKSWWDTVGAIASHFAGVVFFDYPETATIMDELMDGGFRGCSSFTVLDYDYDVLQRFPKVRSSCTSIIIPTFRSDSTSLHRVV